MIEAIISFFTSCNLLQAGRLCLDYLGCDPVEYVIEAVPCAPILTQYTDGGSLRQYLFIFASREAYGADVLQNIQNSNFYENMAAWIEQCSEGGILPVLPAPLVAQRLDIVSSGYVLEDGTDNARYQMQLRLVYYQPKV